MARCACPVPSIFVQVAGRNENRVTLGCFENCFTPIQQGAAGIKGNKDTLPEPEEASIRVSLVPLESRGCSP